MFYQTLRDDPIFPSKYNPYISNLPYSYNYTRPAILGCVHDIYICHPGSLDCYQLAPHLPDQSAFNKTMDSLVESEIVIDVLSTLLTVSMKSLVEFSGHLDATSKCVFNQCNAFANRQWQFEARRWFETSLASVQIMFSWIVRTQGEVLPVSIGKKEYSYDNPFPKITPNYQKICRMGKFHAEGWRNVST